jgi:N4-gp56 family major capsid protein
MSGEILYGAADGSTSTVGSQLRTDYYYKKALVEAAKEQYFGQLANVRAMPKNMGKTIKQYHYMPILDDRNLNDQGIDAAGLVGGVNGAVAQSTIVVSQPNAAGTAGAGEDRYFTASDANATYATATTNALAAAQAKIVAWLLQLGFNTTNDTYAELSVTGAGGAYDAGYRFAAATTHADSGNLYGSSKDVGTITGKIPALSESGGRVNRVGMRRIELTATLEKFGFFDEYSAESVNFDTDEELEMHITNETVKAANEITEDQLQIDLLNGAGVIRYTGNATSTATLNGGLTLGAGDAVTYDDLVKLSIELDRNRCPKQTTVINGSRMIDTKVVNAARYMYIGSELVPAIMRMTDYHSNQAFIPVAKYASAGTIARGEIGAVADFRIVVVPEMMKWENAGAAVADTDGGELYQWTSTNYDVFPMLVVGEGSFTTIGFQTDGKSVKFKIKHVKPESSIAYSKDDPFGEMGFYSIKWYYAIMLLRPERIALLKTVAVL